jgi:hypothetical protein
MGGNRPFRLRNRAAEAVRIPYDRNAPWHEKITSKERTDRYEAGSFFPKTLSFPEKICYDNSGRKAPKGKIQPFE